jgi:hypothetical protein
MVRYSFCNFQRKLIISPLVVFSATGVWQTLRLVIDNCNADWEYVTKPISAACKSGKPHQNSIMKGPVFESLAFCYVQPIASCTSYMTWSASCNIHIQSLPTTKIGMTNWILPQLHMVRCIRHQLHTPRCIRHQLHTPRCILQQSHSALWILH